jgi:hypothetical protein
MTATNATADTEGTVGTLRNRPSFITIPTNTRQEDIVTDTLAPRKKLQKKASG